MSFVYKKVEGKTKQNMDGKHGPIKIHPDYEGKEHFWNTLDTRLVNWTYELHPVIGGVLRFVFAVIPPGTNRMQPYPTGNKDKVDNLWQDKPHWVRWLFWHFRNFMQDFRKYYLGFGTAFYEDRLWFAGYHIPKNSRPDSIWKEVRIGFWLPKFHFLPFKVPFPIIELRPYPGVTVPIRFVLGWKKRGLFSLTFQKTD